MADPDQRPPAELLVEALETLSAADRRRVTSWLLQRGSRAGNWWAEITPSGQSGPWTDPALRRALAHSVGDLAREQMAARLLTGGALRGEHQVVPVRLPAALHTQLRDWCAEHGFAMATVVRGLVARFLEGQAPAEQPPADQA